ncbi:MAG: COG1361 family protein [Planctomycetota bacterium]|jgi:uncharacterized repeat protein (TIGR01451 family)
MKQKHFLCLVYGITLMSIAAGLGCRTHYPHSFSWPATGIVELTHPKPPEGAYYTDWDPYSATIELEPLKDVNPVRTQHVLVATIKDCEGKPLPNRRVEWIIAEGSVGDIVEVDESGFRASRGHKINNDYAISHTNNYAHVLDRGNDDPSDDVQLCPGQTWCTITSPVEGATYITAYAPGIYNWDNHKVTVVKQWYDVAWEWPSPDTNPVNTPHTLVTKVMKYSDGAPLVDYIVNYKIASGPAGTLTPGGGSTASVKTNAQGLATVTLKQAAPAEGTNDIQIEIIRPEDVQCCKPAIFIAEGTTQKTWIAPKIKITKDAVSRAIIGETFTYNIKVANISQVAANNVAVTDTLPNSIQYVSSKPSAKVSGQKLSWSLGTLAAGSTTNITVKIKGTKTGKFTNCANVTADLGLSDKDCADTLITAPKLALEKQCPGEVMICDPITYTIMVKNPGDAPAKNVRITDKLPAGLKTQDGRKSASFNIGTLGAGQSKHVNLTVKADKTGKFTNKAQATADGGLTAGASCSTKVTQPVLKVTKTGPNVRYVGRPVKYEITVSNTGDTVAKNTVLVDNMASGVTFVSASKGGQQSNGRVTWNLGSLKPGASKKVTVTVKSNQRGKLRDKASATAVCAKAEAEAVTTIKGIPAILLEVIDVEDPIEVGTNETYLITVTNQGSADGTNIIVKAVLPSEQDYVSAKGPTKHSVDDKTILFAPLPSLDPKAKVTYTLKVKGTKAGDVRFKAALNSDQIGEPVEETESTHIY